MQDIGDTELANSEVRFGHSIENDYEESDIRSQELDSIKAIYPEAVLSKKRFCGTVDIMVVTDDPVTVVLKSGKEAKVGIEAKEQQMKEVKAKIHYLPSLVFQFKLPQGYPYQSPPIISLLSSWIPSATIGHLNLELLRLWESFHDLVIFTMIDFLQEKASNLFDLAQDNIYFTTSKMTFDNFKEFDKYSILQKFNNETFTCDICQEDRKGLYCSKFSDCGHVFCIQCLRNYFESYILSSDIDKIHCPDFNCTKRFTNLNSEILKELDKDDNYKRIAEIEETFFMPPLSKKFLLKIISEELFKKYFDLFMKRQFDLFAKYFPTKSVQCPDVQCRKQFIRENQDDLLTICPSCKFAFCFKCKHSWHGPNNLCRNIEADGIPQEEILIWIENESDSKARLKLNYKYGKKTMELASKEYISDKLFEEAIKDPHSDLQKCPFCRTVIQRSEGCNKMRCSQCFTIFCNLCGQQLHPSDPYEHFRERSSECYGKLFDGMAGTEEAEMDHGFQFLAI
ncbi:hypothetical protein PACTADRAFT_77085 [Pachysolen tannophilus NRRL Y-2460]|uniref:RBR-type E3 ubiquitin transferase n=1 Tax=Pachysolen tannophilus NRRL Y-2460 TaxID=669874 RepID=A0A1E4TRW7_PACTA|nr:hypothetical protein PACTADRAFT_77085 [Pachysolen tannophilus NRRL Y-2460]